MRCLMFGDRLVMAGGGDKRIRIWDRASEVLVKTLKGHRGAVKFVHFDDHKIISAGADGVIKVLPLVVCALTLICFRCGITGALRQSPACTIF